MLRLTSNIVKLQWIFLLVNVYKFAAAEGPYCMKNETETTYTTIIKTRLVQKEPTGVFKIFKKKTNIIETFTEQVPHVHWRAITNCCEGYYKTEVGICEPHCRNGCPPLAYCFEPNRCQCQKGYISAVSTENGTHYCEPKCVETCPLNARCTAPNICECNRGYHAQDNIACIPQCSSGCPHGGECIEPEVCKCKEGYRAELGTCKPVCEEGYGCRNGACVDVETCICNNFFVKNEVTKICEPEPCEAGCSTVPSATDVNSASTTIEDGNEKIYLSTEVPYGSISVQKCASGLTFYNGDCRATQFDSETIHCKFKPCTENAFCHDNGTCSCNKGYTWHNHSMQSDEIANSEPLPICVTFEQLNTILGDEQTTESSDWWITIGIGIGVLCIMGAVLFLGIQKMYCRRPGKLDVQAKTDLCCEYDNRCYNDSVMVL